jgi:hypothetical protein
MIKLNLLPGYVHEKGRIQASIAIFLIVVGLEVGVILWAKQGYEAQAKWFATDKTYYTERTTMIDSAITASKSLAEPSKKYETLVTFFKRGPVVDNMKLYTSAMAAVPQKLGSTGAWFEDMNISKKEVTLTGKVKGIMNFVDFYFMLKGKGFTVKPGDPGPMPWPKNPRIQEIPITLTCTLDAEVPEAAKGPEGAQPWTALYKKRGEGAPAADPNAPQGEGGAPPSPPTGASTDPQPPVPPPPAP